VRTVVAVDRKRPLHSAADLGRAVELDRAPYVAIRDPAGARVSRFARESVHEKPALRELRRAGEARRAHCGVPTAGQTPRNPTGLLVERLEHSIGRSTSRGEKTLVSAEAVAFENSAQRVGDRMGERPLGVVQAALREPAIVALRTQGPANVGQAGLAVAPAGIEAIGFEQAPSDMGLVFL